MSYHRRNSRYGPSSHSQWAPYVSVAERKQEALKHRQAMEKKGQVFNPIIIEGRTIAKTFWGKAWCDNLEAYSDYSNRLPRGRTYVRNGSVIDLHVSKGQIKAQVMGSSLYHIVIEVIPLITQKWQTLVKACAGKIDSLIELLQGKFSKSVMEIITEKEGGLFPKPKEIKMKCSCPDSAGMCKHIAAVLYGVGASLDHKPEWLFALRHVDHVELIASAGSGAALMPGHSAAEALEESAFASLFGIEMDNGLEPKVQKPSGKATQAQKTPAPLPVKSHGKAAKVDSKVVVSKKATPKKEVPLKELPKKLPKEPLKKPSKRASPPSQSDGEVLIWVVDDAPKKRPRAAAAPKALETAPKKPAPKAKSTSPSKISPKAKKSAVVKHAPAKKG